jgi:hypothetical protein
MKKHNATSVKFNTEILPSKDFQDAVAQIAEKFDPVENCEEYLKEFNLIKLRFCPELEELQNEVNEIHKKYAATL